MGVFLFRRAVAFGTAVSLLTIITSVAGAATLDCGATVDPRFTEAATLCGAGQRTPRVDADMIERPRAVSVSYAKTRRAAYRSGARRVGRVDPLIHAVGHSYRVDPLLLSAMVRAESGGRQNAVSHKGALGLMQVMPGTARGLGIRQPRALLEDPALALSAGALYLKTLQAKFGNNLPLVVAAYNAGPGAVAKAGMRIPRYRETQGYVSTVLGRYGSLRLAR